VRSPLVPADDLMREFHPEIVDPVMCDVDQPPSPDEPLVKIKVTSFSATGETSITFAFCHVLGDGLTFFRFTNLVSQFYCNDVPGHPIPSYDNYFHAPPCLPRSLAQDIARAYAPHLLKTYSPKDFLSLCERSFTTTTRIDVHFSLAELTRLKSHASREAGRTVSKQDALAAYLITAINRVRGPQIQQVINLVDYRGDGSTPDGYKVPDATSSGSALLHVFSDTIPAEDSCDIGKVARLVGDTVRQVKDAEFVRQVVATTTAIMGEVFGANRQAWWGAGEHSVVLNNCYKLHSPSNHFGFRGQARFYVNGSMERYLRIWAGNPKRLSDGSWKSNEGSADVSFRLEHELKEPFLRLLTEQRQSWARSSRPVPSAELSLQEMGISEFSRL